MYLERVSSKGRTYLYLKTYKVRKDYSNPYKTIYRFGRVEEALENMYLWKRDFGKFPKELLSFGCNKGDLDNWIETLETGVHKRTGRKFIIVNKRQKEKK